MTSAKAGMEREAAHRLESGAETRGEIRAKAGEMAEFGGVSVSLPQPEKDREQSSRKEQQTAAKQRLKGGVFLGKTVCFFMRFFLLFQFVAQAKLFKKGGEHVAAYLFQNPFCDIDLMVKGRHLQNI